METSPYTTRHNNKTSTSPSLLLLKTPPLEETKSTTTTSSIAAMAAFLSYLSPFPSSSSNSNKNRSNDRKNLRLVNSTDPMLTLSPQIGCMGQIKTRKSSTNGARKGKRKESSLIVRFLAPLFKGSSKVRDVPRSVKVVRITEMDPPLPVKERNREDDLYKVSLWERRFGGKELQKLQLKEKRRQVTTIAEIHFFGN